MAIVETGTYLATTTEFFAQTGLPVYSVEGHRRNFGFARARLMWKRNVVLVLGDSRQELTGLLDGPLGKQGGEPLFVYLDAHWNADLPLADELEIVFSRVPNAVVMIDDFEVPGDADYGYDDYGPGKALNAAYIAPAVATHGLSVFYPATPGIQETGARRGCAVLVKSETNAKKLRALDLLREATQKD